MMPAAQPALAYGARQFRRREGPQCQRVRQRSRCRGAKNQRGRRGSEEAGAREGWDSTMRTGPSPPRAILYPLVRLLSQECPLRRCYTWIAPSRGHAVQEGEPQVPEWEAEVPEAGSGSGPAEPSERPEVGDGSERFGECRSWWRNRVGAAGGGGQGRHFHAA